jgi:hypothetical protein
VDVIIGCKVENWIEVAQNWIQMLALALAVLSL